MTFEDPIKLRFEEREDVEKVTLLRRNRMKELIYYTINVMTAFLLFKLSTNLQYLKSLCYDRAEKIDQSDYIFVELHSGKKMILRINKIKAKIIPYKATDYYYVVNFSKQRFFFCRRTNSFKRLGQIFPDEFKNDYAKVKRFFRPLEDREYAKLFSSYGKNVFKVHRKSLAKAFKSYFKNPIMLFNGMAVLYLIFYEDQVAYGFRKMLLLAVMFIIKRYNYNKEVDRLEENCSKSNKIFVYRRDEYETRKLYIDDSDVTVGDLIEINERDIINFDCYIFAGSCVVDQSTLTGESIPIIKKQIKATKPVHDYNKILAGSKCIQKNTEKVFGIVSAVGFDSFQGRLISNNTGEKTLPFRFYSDLIKLMTVMLIFFMSNFIFNVVYNIIRQRFSFNNSLFILIQIILKAYPFSLFFMLFLIETLTTARLREKEVRKISNDYVIKAGRMNMVCFDKTGTLVEDTMKLEGMIISEDRVFSPFQKDIQQYDGASKTRTLELLANCHSLNLIKNELIGDPLEKEIQRHSGFTIEKKKEKKKKKDKGKKKKKKVKKVDYNEDYFNKIDPKNINPLLIRPTDDMRINLNYPSDFKFEIHQYKHFDSKRKMMTVVTNSIEDDETVNVYTKGAPETVIKRCIIKTLPMNLKNMLDMYSSQGMRILAFGHKQMKKNELGIAKLEEKLNFLGLMLFNSPLKPGITKTIKCLNMSDVRSIIITGDALKTSVNCGYKSGILNESERVWLVKIEKEAKALKIEQLDYKQNKRIVTISDKDTSIDLPSILIEFRDMFQDCKHYNYKLAIDGESFDYILNLAKNHSDFIEQFFEYTMIYGRCSPSQKKRIVKNYKLLKNKEDFTVGFVGDGANDAEALCEADIGLSLGNSFSSIVASYYTKSESISKIKDVAIRGKFGLEISVEITKIVMVTAITDSFVLIFLGYLNLNNTGYEFVIKTLVTFTGTIIIVYGDSGDRMTCFYPNAGYLNKEVLIPLATSVFMILFLIFVFYTVQINELIFKDIGEIIYNIKRVFYGDHNFFGSKLLALFVLFRYSFVVVSYSERLPFGKSLLVHYGLLTFLGTWLIYNTLVLFEHYNLNYYWQWYIQVIVRWTKLDSELAFKYFFLIVFSSIFWTFLYRVISYKYKIELLERKLRDMGKAKLT